MNISIGSAVRCAGSPSELFDVAKEKIIKNLKRGVEMVVSNRWTGLWTGLLDWTAGLDYWTDF